MLQNYIFCMYTYDSALHAFYNFFSPLHLCSYTFSDLVEWEQMLELLKAYRVTRDAATLYCLGGNLSDTSDSEPLSSLPDPELLPLLELLESAELLEEERGDATLQK